MSARVIVVVSFALGAATCALGAELALTSTQVAVARLAPDVPSDTVVLDVDEATEVQILIASTANDVATEIIGPGGELLNEQTVETYYGCFQFCEGPPAPSGFIMSPCDQPGFHYIYVFPWLGPGSYTVNLYAPPGGLSDQPALIIELITDSAVGCNLLALDPVVTQGTAPVLTAFVFENAAPVSGAEVSVWLKPPVGDSVTIALLDNGEDGDHAVGDGLYSAVFLAEQVGEYLAVADITGLTSNEVPFARVASARVRVVAQSATFGSGAFTDQGVDTNGNGLYDRLCITAPISIITAGDYILSIMLETATGQPLRAYGYATLAGGPQSMTACIQAAAILATGENGPYTIREADLMYVSSEGAVPADALHDLSQQTQAYLLSQFEGPPLYLTGEVSDVAIDDDTDGDFDRLQVTLGLYARAADEYACSACLVADCGAYFQCISNPVPLVSGLQTLTLEFAGAHIGAHGIDGPYEVRDLNLYGHDGAHLSLWRAATTSAYEAMEFDGFVPSADCNDNGLPDSCDLEMLRSSDCNGNGVPDSCDVSSGFSLDYDGNGVPDECQPDCNDNGIPDVCDISSGVSQDCNGNHTPDECDVEAGTSLDCNHNGVPDECQDCPCPDWLPGFVRPGFNSRVNAVVNWDPDGDGPLPAQLVAGGSFSQAGGVSLPYIATWDEPLWRPLGTGVNGTVYALATWDPDGEGPQPPLLVAGGSFTHAGGGAASRIACWDGSNWQALGAGLNGTVNAVTTWDPDGAGPAHPQLVVGGNFTYIGSSNTMIRHVARWDGSAWQAFGTGMEMNSSIRALALWHESAGAPARLVAAGDFTPATGQPATRVACWDGSGWQAFSSGVASRVHALVEWDCGGTGVAQVVTGGEFSQAGSAVVNYIARWDGSAWCSIGGAGMSGTYAEVRSLINWDPDGGGPLLPELVAAGQFTRAGSTVANYIASWNGNAWRRFGLGLSGYAYAVTTWDPDGDDGPLPAYVVAGGSFTQADGSAANRVAMWDGAAWQPLGTGLDNTVWALTTWDPDGDGPLWAQVVAGGDFATAGGNAASRIAVWDGVAWQPCGSGVNSTVYALASWDPDGDGPLPPLLVAGGAFTQADGSTANRIACWNGSAWQTLGTGVTNYVRALATWDPDGAGPLPAQLVAGGDFTGAGGAAASRIARWNGSVWQPCGSGVNSTVYALATWDPDGEGALLPQLVVGGYFTQAGGSPASRIARWDGSSWWPFGAGLSSQPYALATWDPDDVGPLAPQVVGGGNFSQAGGVASSRIAFWDGRRAPSIIEGPESQSLLDGADAIFVVRSVATPVPAYQWLRDGELIADGPSIGGGTVSGATTASLAISNAGVADSGEYWVIVWNDCGEVISAPAALSVGRRGDVNCDGLVNSFDLDPFISCLVSGTPYPGCSCDRADINCDGTVNSFDIDPFVLCLTGACPSCPSDCPTRRAPSFGRRWRTPSLQPDRPVSGNRSEIRGPGWR